ncbi:SDR family NAD(P)-dependent oxidoreductase [Pseudonocardia alni]|uniref:SDR family NAD(P)-dependent oxidoreductase n=1 Tax=Pseudonocardia alni TaxID=33907 RepID=UPI00332F588E
MSGPTGVVTGAGSGIGAAAAVALAPAGGTTVLVGRRADALERTAHAVRASGGEAVVLPLDVTADDAGDRAVAAARTATGRLDVVVSAAGAYRPGAFGTLTAAHVREVTALHHLAPLLLADAAVRAFRSAGRPGRIVHVSSITGLVSRGGFTAYEAAKAALIAGARSAAVELAAESVPVNTVAPGWIRSEMTAELLATAPAGALGAFVPAGRPGEAAEIAEVVRWVALDAPAFLTGQTIAVDGGQSVRTGALTVPPPGEDLP